MQSELAFGFVLVMARTRPFHPADPDGVFGCQRHQKLSWLSFPFFISLFFMSVTSARPLCAGATQGIQKLALQAANQQQQTPRGVLIIPSKYTSAIYLVSAGCCLFESAATAPSRAMHDPARFQGNS